MIKKDFQQYATQTWQNDSYIKSLSEVSGSGCKKEPLIDRPEKVYSFDSICDKIYRKNKPTSADGLFFCNDAAYFVEFKTGFKKKITRDNYNEKEALCPKNQQFCEYYRDLFFKKQDKETDELKYSIKFKVLESYITLEKEILPLCKDAHESEIIFVVVIDADGIDDYEDSLAELSEDHAPHKTVKNNCICSLKDSLKGYIKKEDKHYPHNDFFYDKIEVFSAGEFEMFFDELLTHMINPSNTAPQTV